MILSWGWFCPPAPIYEPMKPSNAGVGSGQALLVILYLLPQRGQPFVMDHGASWPPR